MSEPEARKLSSAPGRPDAPSWIMRLALLLVGCCQADTLLAQAPAGTAVSTDMPMQAKGVDGASVFAVSDLDTVNTYNGMLNLALPIGPLYPMPGGTSYQIAAHYTGDPWDQVEAHCIRLDHNQTGGNDDQISAYVPDRSSNMGLGWEIGFGRLLAPQTVENRGSFLIYEAADGSRQEFKQGTTDLPNTSFQSGQGAEQTWFSVDGSGSRLRFGPEPTSAILTLANGGRIEFRNIETFIRRDGTSNNESDWRATRIYLGHQANGNFLNIEYNTTSDQWIITDSASTRRHVISFESRNYWRGVPVTGQELPALTRKFKKITAISLAGMGGQNITITPQYFEEGPITAGNVAISRYTYQFGVEHGCAIARNRTRTDQPWVDTIFAKDQSINADAEPHWVYREPFLRGLKLPDESFYAFEYFRSDGIFPTFDQSPPTGNWPGVVFGDYESCQAVPTHRLCDYEGIDAGAKSGGLWRMRYPTGKWVEYSYSKPTRQGGFAAELFTVTTEPPRHTPHEYSHAGVLQKQYFQLDQDDISAASTRIDGNTSGSTYPEVFPHLAASAGSSNALGTWRLQPDSHGIPAALPDLKHELGTTAVEPPCYVARTITGLDGTKTQYFYNNISSNDEYVDTRLASLRGMPFTACDPLAANGDGIANYFGPRLPNWTEPAVQPTYLSAAGNSDLLYPTGGQGPFLSTITYADNGRPLRSTWVQYGEVFSHWNDDAPRHVVKIREETRYHDPLDPNAVVVAYVRTRYEGYNGFGGFTKVTTESARHTAQGWQPWGAKSVENLAFNFADGYEVRFDLRLGTQTGCVNGTRDYSDWGCGKADRALTLNPNPSTDWFIGQTRQTRSEHWPVGQNAAQTVATNEFCYDQRGFPTSTRIYANNSPNPTRSSNDIVKLARRDYRGNPIEQITAGGDLDSLAIPTNLSCESLPSRSSFVARTRTVFHPIGVPTRTDTLSADGSMRLRGTESTLDATTGAIMAAVDANGLSARYEYDQMGRVLRSHVQNSSGVVKSVNSYAYSYPRLNRLQDKLWFASVTCRSLADCPKQPTNGSDPEAFLAGITEWAEVNRLEFDVSGKPERSRRRHGSGEAQSITRYDARQRPIAQSVPFDIRTDANDPSIGWTLTDYDLLGRAYLITNPDGSKRRQLFDRGGDWHITNQVLTAAGNVEALSINVLDPLGQITESRESKTGAANTCATANDPNCLTSSYDYDAAGHLIAVCVKDTDGDGRASTCKGQQRRFIYDGRGFQLTAVYPELTTQAYLQFDSAGHMLSLGYPDDPDLDVINVYDPFGRLTQTVGNVSGIPKPLTELFYARRKEGNNLSANRVAEVRQHNFVGLTPTDYPTHRVTVSERYRYGDSLGQLSEYRVRASTGEPNTLRALGVEFVSTMSFDSLGRQTQIGYPTCLGAACTAAPTRQVSQHYVRNQLHSVGDGGNPAAWIENIGYLPNGSIAFAQRSNGTTDWQDLDAFGWRLSKVRTTASSQANSPVLFGQSDLRYDARGNLVSHVALGAGNAQTLTFAYDGLNRLTSGETVDHLGQKHRQEVVYDDFGNITTLTNIAANASPVPVLSPSNVDSANNRLKAAAGSPLPQVGYDARGNTTELAIMTGQSVAQLQFEYDPQGRMRASRELGGTASNSANSYLYNASGERLAAFYLGDFSARWTPRNPNNRVLREFAETNSNTNASIRFNKDFIDLSGSTIAEADANGHVVHLHQDHLGSTRLTTTAKGSTQDFFTYWPFGGYTPGGDGGGKPAGIRYTGHERDKLGSSTELDYMHARYGLMNLGRFTQVDPVLGSPGAATSWNRYAYAYNSPMVNSDPDGREAGQSESRKLVSPQGATDKDYQNLYNRLRAKDGLSHEEAMAKLRVAQRQERAHAAHLARLAAENDGLTRVPRQSTPEKVGDPFGWGKGDRGHHAFATVAEGDPKVASLQPPEINRGSGRGWGTAISDVAVGEKFDVDLSGQVNVGRTLPGAAPMGMVGQSPLAVIDGKAGNLLGAAGRISGLGGTAMSVREFVNANTPGERAQIAMSEAAGHIPVVGNAAALGLEVGGAINSIPVAGTTVGGALSDHWSDSKIVRWMSKWTP